MVRLLRTLVFSNILVLFLICNGAFSFNNNRRDVHRIIITEKIARGRNNHHYPREHIRLAYGSAEHGSDFLDNPSYIRKVKKPPPNPAESTEDRSTSFSSDWRPIPVRKQFIPSIQLPPKIAPSLNKTNSAPAPREELVSTTTRVPVRNKLPSVYKNNLNQVNHMNYFTYKVTQNASTTAHDAQESRVKASFASAKLSKKPVPKKVDGGYQVYEYLDEDTYTPKPTNFNVFSPSVVRSVPLYPPLPYENTIKIDKKKEITASFPRKDVIKTRPMLKSGAKE